MSMKQSEFYELLEKAGNEFYPFIDDDGAIQLWDYHTTITNPLGAVSTLSLDASKTLPQDWGHYTALCARIDVKLIEDVIEATYINEKNKVRTKILKSLNLIAT